MITRKRLIDANELKKKASMKGHSVRPLITAYHMCVSVRDIDNAPTVDAVEGKHGRWHEVPYIDKIACSVCGNHWSIIDNCTETFNYCPNCGADMRGDWND